MKTILIVDDDQDFTTAIAILLHSAGYGTRSVHTLNDARRLLQTQRFDVVMLDFMLPDGCGVELLDERLFSRAILITGHPGVNAFIKNITGPKITKLTKPATFEQIQAAIEHLDAPEEEVEEDTFNGRTIREIEKRMIVSALREQPSKRAAARVLGISLNTLYNRISMYGMISVSEDAA